MKALRYFLCFIEYLSTSQFYFMRCVFLFLTFFWKFLILIHFYKVVTGMVVFFFGVGLKSQFSYVDATFINYDIHQFFFQKLTSTIMTKKALNNEEKPGNWKVTDNIFSKV